MNPIAQALAQAASLLQQQQFEPCMQLCSQWLRQRGAPVEFLHLMALAQQRSGRMREAQQSFEQLLAKEPRKVEYLLSHGRFLRAQGNLVQAERCLRKACKLAPQSHQAWHALGLLLLATGSGAEAARVAQRVTELAPSFAPGWELLAAAAQQQGDLDAAIQACKRGLGQLPRAPRLHYSLAQLLRQCCEFDAAAEAYAQARACGLEDPELYRNHVDALIDGGHTEQALAIAREGVRRFPQHALLQRVTANLHAEVGAEGDPLGELRAAAQAAGVSPALWQALIELQIRLGREEDASASLQQALARGVPQSPGMGILLAQEAARRGDPGAASRHFETLLAGSPEDSNIAINFAMHLLSHADPARAAALCEQVLQREPLNQLALAYLGTAWQLLEDPRTHWLCDYERMVIPVPIPVPEPYPDTAAFFTELTQVLEEQHHARSHPLEQSVRGGSQTNGFLFRLPHPLLQVLERQIRAAVASALPRFADDTEHPFWGRSQQVRDAAGLRFAGAWSVRLRSQGFHTNHIHPQGWISSALYVSLPAVVRTGTGTAGHIQFGQPLSELGLSLPAQRTVRPQVGTLVLFPSYMWHGTVPFESDEPRITVAFDLLPSH